MSSIYKKAVKKLSAGSGEDPDVPAKPKRSLSFKRKKKEKDDTSSKTSSLRRSSSERSRTRTSTDSIRSEERKVASPLPSVLEAKAPKADTAPEEAAQAITFLHETESSPEQLKTDPATELAGVQVEVPATVPTIELTEPIEPTVSEPAEPSVSTESPEPTEPLLERTPKEEPPLSPKSVPYQSIDNKTQQRAPSNANDESQPLLSNFEFSHAPHEPTDSAPSSLYKFVSYFHPANSRALLYLLFLLVAVSILAYYTVTNIDIFISQSVQFNVQNISVMGVTNDGLDTRFVGSVYVDYSEIPSFYFRNLLIVGGTLFGALTIASPPNGLKLFVKPQSLDVAPIHLVDVYPPEVVVSVVGGTLTQLDFVSKVNLVKENLVQFGNDLNKLSTIDDENLSFDVRAEFATDLITRFFSFSTNEINFNDRISLPKSKFQPTFDILDFKLSDLGDGKNEDGSDSTLLITSAVRIDELLPFAFDLPEINWDISIDGCDDLVQFGYWKSNSFSVFPGVPIVVSINGTLRDLPPELSQKCKDGFNPLNKLVQYYVDGRAIHIVIKASSDQDNELPEWLFYVLHYLNYDVRVKLPALGMITYDDLSLQSMDLEFGSGRDVDFRLQSNMTMLVEDLFGIRFQIPQFSNEFVLKDATGSSLISGQSNGHNALKIGHHSGKLEFDFNFKQYEMKLLDSKLVGRLISDLLNFSSSHYYADFDISDLHFESKYFSTVFNKLSVSNWSIGTHQMQGYRSIYDDIFKMLNITITDLQLALSTPEGVVLHSVVSIVNPTPYSIDMPNDEITLGLNFANSSQNFGFVVLKDVYIPAQGSFTLDAMIHIFVDKTPESRIELEHLLGSFISGYHNLSVDIGGNSIKNRPKLNDLIEGINIHNFLIPSISFSNSEESNGPSPFIIASTIHVLTSEVELTLFNPISNLPIEIDIYQAEAKSGNVVIGHLQKVEHVVVPSGIHRTSRIPMQINQGMGMDVLKRAINGDLVIDVLAMINVKLEEFGADLVYSGSGLTAQIKL